MKIPNLFIVGAPKCGTTSLHSYLSQHPDVFMTKHKEPRHFCTDLDLRNNAKHYTDPKEYLSLFRNAGDVKIAGEATTFYLYSSRACREIKKFNPKANIIIMLRHPVDMMYSWHGQSLNLGEENVKNFKKALELEDNRLQGKNIPSASPFRFASCYKTMASFSKYIRLYKDTYRKDQILYLLLEDVSLQPELTLQKVLQFLNIDPDFKPDYSPQNQTANKKIRNVSIREFLQNHPNFRRIISRSFPENTRRFIGDTISIVGRTTVCRPNKMPPKLYRDLSLSFQHEIQELEDIINRDLSHWKISD